MDEDKPDDLFDLLADALHIFDDLYTDLHEFQQDEIKDWMERYAKLANCELKELIGALPWECSNGDL